MRVQRNGLGEIVAIFANDFDGKDVSELEQIADDHPDILAYLEQE